VGLTCIIETQGAHPFVKLMAVDASESSTYGEEFVESLLAPSQVGSKRSGLTVVD